MKRTMAIIICLSLLTGVTNSANAADVLSIATSQQVTGSAGIISNIWKGDIPTKIGYPSGTFSQKLEFPIQGLLPYLTLADRSTGVEVEFEIWSPSGKKVAYDTVYEFDWNPVGPNTLVSMYLYESEAIGTHTMLIRTIYNISTNGLLTRYTSSDVKIPVQIVSYSKPSTIVSLSAQWVTDALRYTFVPSTDASKIKSYEVGILYLKSNGADKTKYANYSNVSIIKNTSVVTFDMTFQEIIDWAKTKQLDLSNSTVMIRVRGVNEWGQGDWGQGNISQVSDINSALLKSIAKKTADEAARIAALPPTTPPTVVTSVRLGWTGKVLTATVTVPPGVRNTSEKVVGIKARAFFGSVRVSTADVDSVITLDRGYQLNINFDLNTLWDTLNLANLPLRVETEYYNLAGSGPLVSTEILKPISVNQNTQVSNPSESPLPKSTVNKSTIICIKGKLVKKVTAVKPVCPAGYKKK